MTTSAVEDIAVTRFREYLRINTSHPNPDYAKASEFYKKYADELGLTYWQVELPQNRVVDLITWEGLEPTLPSIMLYSHTDVVPSFPEHWKYDPFSAHKEENGDIYARGAQVVEAFVSTIEAILKYNGAFKRFGLQILNRAPQGNGDFTVVLTNDREINTRALIEQKIINTFLDFRAQQEKRLQEDSSLSLGDVISVNLTMLKGGVQYNVVPDSMTAGFDIRVPPTADLVEFEKTVSRWCTEAGSGVTFRYLHHTMDDKITKLDQNNPWWVAFQDACNKAGVTLRKEIFPAGTDGRALRKRDIPVFGFSPMNHTPVLLHDHNEFLNEGTFLRGVELYTHILAAVGSVCI